MKTQQELEAMTDFELSCAVLEFGKWYNGEEFTKNEAPSKATFKSGNAHYHFDINDWCDCGKLIDGLSPHRLAIGRDFVEYVRIGVDYTLIQNSPSIKRAITIVYILIKQGE